jgi:hypothetical protein
MLVNAGECCQKIERSRASIIQELAGERIDQTNTLADMNCWCFPNSIAIHTIKQPLGGNNCGVGTRSAAVAAIYFIVEHSPTLHGEKNNAPTYCMVQCSTRIDTTLDGGTAVKSQLLFEKKCWLNSSKISRRNHVDRQSDLGEYHVPVCACPSP